MTEAGSGPDPGPGQSNPLDLRPVRLAEWEEQAPRPAQGSTPAEPDADPEAGSEGEAPDGRVVIERPIPGGWSPRAILERLSAMTGVRRLRLDPRGSFLWRRIDGERTIGALATELRDAFGDAVEPAEERVTRFLSWLERERLVEHRDPAGRPAKLGRR